jgi:hypothetical protein
MSVIAAPVVPNCSPSDYEAGGIRELSRHQQIRIGKVGTLSAAVLEDRFYFPCAGRILGVTSFRRTAGSGAGAGGSTDVDVNLNGTSILAATKMEHENADGNATKVVGNLDTAHAAADDYGIVVAAGDYLEVQIDAIEAGATAPLGLYVQVDFLVG